MALSREEVLARLKEIKAPSGVDIVEAGLVRIERRRRCRTFRDGSR